MKQTIPTTLRVLLAVLFCCISAVTAQAQNRVKPMVQNKQPIEVETSTAAPSADKGGKAEQPFPTVDPIRGEEDATITAADKPADGTRTNVTRKQLVDMPAEKRTYVTSHPELYTIVE